MKVGHGIIEFCFVLDIEIFQVIRRNIPEENYWAPRKNVCFVEWSCRLRYEIEERLWCVSVHSKILYAIGTFQIMNALYSSFSL